MLVALGGGAHVRRYGARLARAIVRHLPGADVRLAAGFVAGHPFAGPSGRVSLDSYAEGLAQELARAAVVVAAGGVTLHEACALACPTVALAVVPAQRRAIVAASRAGLVLDAGQVQMPASFERAARGVRNLLAAPAAARAIGARAASVVDGEGVTRVARRLTELMDRDRADRVRHAA